MRAFYRVLCGLLIWFVLFTAGAKEKNVLLVHSYHSTFQWTDDITDGFLSRLKDLAGDVNVDVVYLDVLRPTVDSEQAFQGFVKQLRNGSYDLLVLCDDEAIDRFRREDNVVPENVPILLIGWVDYDENIRKERANLTALLQDADISGTIDLGLKLFPEPPREIVILTDAGIAGKRIYRDTKKTLEGKTLPPVRFIRGEEFSTLEMLQKMETFPPDTLIVYTQWLGKQEDYQAVCGMGKQCIAVSRAPVFSTVSTWMPNGLVGGSMVYGKYHGEEVAGIAADILAGVPAASIPFRMGKTFNVVDYPQTQLRGLILEKLPLSVQIVNRPPTVWRKYRGWLLAISGAVAAILLLLGALLIFAFRSRNLTRQQLAAQKELLALQKERYAHVKLFQITLNSIGDAVIATDAEERVIHLNPAAETFIGVQGTEASGQRLASIFRILPEGGGVPISPVRQALQTGETVSLVCMVKPETGGSRRAAAVASPIFDDSGRLFGAVLVFHQAAG